MFDFHEKRKIRSFLYSKLSIAIVLLLVVWLSMSTYERFSVEREMLSKRSEKQAELDHLKERAAVLESKVEHLNNERGIEEELRNRFDVAKEGEQVVIILDDKDGSPKDLESLSQPPGVKSEQESTSSLFEMLKFW